jgi:hypothetical protein
MKSIDRFKDDLNLLISKANQLDIALHHEFDPEGTKRFLGEQKSKENVSIDSFINKLPNVKQSYQSWYTESLAVIKQLIPDRVQDFVRHYEKPKGRKDITFESYRIEDYLQGLTSSRNGQVIASPKSALPHFKQQFAILDSAKVRIESSLFEIRQIVQADLYDSEIEAAEGLLKNKFNRAAGALAGVVLERHLAQVCIDRAISISKKNPTISDFNDSLKSVDVIDVPTWRFIQHLTDIRNLCDHARNHDPTHEQVADLLNGVKKIIKTVF